MLFLDGQRRKYFQRAYKQTKKPGMSQGSVSCIFADQAVIFLVVLPEMVTSPARLMSISETTPHRLFFAHHELVTFFWLIL